MFAKKQPDQLREKLSQIERDQKIGKLLLDVYEQQKVRTLHVKSSYPINKRHDSFWNLFLYLLMFSKENVKLLIEKCLMLKKINDLKT